jgi:hypothetical protein
MFTMHANMLFVFISSSKLITKEFEFQPCFKIIFFFETQRYFKICSIHISKPRFLSKLFILLQDLSFIVHTTYFLF